MSAARTQSADIYIIPCITMSAPATLAEDDSAKSYKKNQEMFKGIWETMSLLQKSSIILDNMVANTLTKGVTEEVAKTQIEAFIQKKEGDETMIRVRVPEFGIMNTRRIETGNELKNLHEHVRILFEWFDNPSK